MAIHEIRVGSIGKDVKGQEVAREAQRTIGVLDLKKVKTAKVYRLEGTTEDGARELAETLFCEPIDQKYSLNEPLIIDTPHVVEVAYKPGVMNPEVGSILKAAHDIGIKLLAADSSLEYYFFGKITKAKAYQILQQLNLLNPAIEHIVVRKLKTLLIKGSMGSTTIIPIRTMNDNELLFVSKDKLFLNIQEMKVIKRYFQKIKRDPTDCELETIAQTWSEHCAHKTFKAKLIVDRKKKQPLIDRIKKEALKHNKHIVSAFVDNSGVMDFYDGYAICGKVETHNSPSAIEPYGGAMTGSGGVFRDILGTGQGAKTIASSDIFCFAHPLLPKEQLPYGCLPPNYLLKAVVAGVKDYGNRMGIPTNNGSVHFHNDFCAKPSVIVGAYGIVPKHLAKKGIVRVGDMAVVVGGRTGRDGIHGATFSSGEMTERTVNVNSSAVQIGNAIEEKRMFDALLEARDKGIIRAMQDCGAGGFSSAIGEMGEQTGVRVDLSKAPLKYQGLSPWEIWISESQERMIVAIAAIKIKRFMRICHKYNVESTELGTFDGSKRLRVYYGKKLVCNLDMEFLYHGLPQRKMTANRPNVILSEAKDLDSSASLRMTTPSTQKDWVNILKQVLSHGNICSKEPIVRLYDQTVQGTNVLQPFSGELMDGPNDAAVIRPLLNKPYGMIVSHGLNPILNKIDPYWGSIWAATEAISNYVAVGGDYKNASLINNYIWPFPDEESLWSLDKSVDAVVDFVRHLKIPVISGKDSLSSTYRGKDGTVIKIPPVLCVSVFGKIPDTSKTVTSDFKKENSVICLVGKQDLEGMAGSIYFDSCHPEFISGSNVPRIDLKLLPKIFTVLYRAIGKGNILSCHDVSEGGLITTVFEMCVGGNMGATISTSEVYSRPDYVIFNETAGCFIAELENKEVAKRLFKNIPYVILGKTQKEKIINVKNKNKVLFNVKIDELKKAWQKPMKKIFS
ncbi:MAG: phosphoribosylformylglycinamidine synthase subunit PurL [Patescibacteria group bacterium]